MAWPVIARGEHALITAPTGNGKTLAAFLWTLDRLLTGAWEPGKLRVVYVSPLKALGTDIRRNLLVPLGELPDVFEEQGSPCFVPKVATRSGDTPQSERRAMLRTPPEILITTPESLNILLTSRHGRTLLQDVRTLILDEIHSVVSSKRGVHLMTAVERLADLAGEFQRIALSATVEPPDRIAEWVAGHVLESPDGEGVYRRRPITIVVPESNKKLEVSVEFPAVPPEAETEGQPLWAELVQRLRTHISANQSTLIFANSRRMVEKIARLINEQSGELIAYSHHGSLSREIRSVVEKRLKQGELRALVATSSLELGIDVGSIDQVLLIQSPASTAAGLQRVGRSGHAVGATSRGVVYPLHPRDLMECAVLARSMMERDLEAQQPIENALDVLAQNLVSMTAQETWDIEELYLAVKQADCYHRLSRSQFDLVLEMLAGRYESTRVRSLRPLLSIDPIDQTVRARRGSERLVYLSGGTIPDRGYYQLRLDGSGAPIGELDEEFVWERSVGDSFSLGIQSWRVQKVTHNDVFVSPASGSSAMAPFWRADARDRSSKLAQAIALFLERAEDELDAPSFREDLEERHALQSEAAEALKSYLRRQRQALGFLPHRHRVVLERTRPASGQADHQLHVIHTQWGGRLNRPFAYALAAAIADEHGIRPEIIHDDDCLIVELPRSISLEDPFATVSQAGVTTLLRRSLEHTGFYGARFREAAGCALVLPKAGLKRRTPLWLHRQRAKELLEAVAPTGDFPLILEAWRSCLHDEFDLDLLEEKLDELSRGEVEVREAVTDSPSPFAASALWKQTNALMYEDDSSRGSGPSQLRSELLREVSLSSQLRPAIPPELISELVAKLQRTADGYAPRTPRELVDWVRERVLIPAGEFQQLLHAYERDRDSDLDPFEGVDERLVEIRFSGADNFSFVCTVDALPRITEAFDLDKNGLSLSSPVPGAKAPPIHALRLLPEEDSDAIRDSDTLLQEVLAEWVRFYGPLNREWPAQVLGVGPQRLETAIEALVADELVVVDELTLGATSLEICDRANLERLLRMLRARSRPQWVVQKPEVLPQLFAEMQNLATPAATLADLEHTLEILFAYPQPARLWESEILPARLDPYLPAWLDSLFAETDIQWLGCGEGTLAFIPASDREIVGPMLTTTGVSSSPKTWSSVLPNGTGRHTLEDLVAKSDRPSADVVRELWSSAWAGEITCDSYAPVRRGIESNFNITEVASSRRHDATRRPRSRFSSWRSGRPFGGAWYRLDPLETEEDDPLLAEELQRDRVRMLFDRFGVLFRELLARELPGMRWHRIFRSLRLMELSGEILGGRFFDGISGLQFISHRALRMIRDDGLKARVWWMNATDPSSPCGLGLQELGYELPRRQRSSHLVFNCTELVVVSERSCASLTIYVEPDDPRLKGCFGFIANQLARQIQPRRSIDLSTINEEAAASSPYLRVLRELFHVTRTTSGVRLSKR